MREKLDIDELLEEANEGVDSRMFNIDFYRTAQGFSDIEDFLDDLEKRAATNKDAQIQHKQVAQYIQFLADHRQSKK